MSEVVRRQGQGNRDEDYPWSRKAKVQPKSPVYRTPRSISFFKSTIHAGKWFLLGLTHGPSMTGNPPHIRGVTVRGSCVCCAFAIPRTSRPLRERHPGERLTMVSLPPHLHLLLATTQQPAYVQQYHQFLAQVRYSQYVICPLRHCYSRRRLYH